MKSKISVIDIDMSNDLLKNLGQLFFIGFNGTTLSEKTKLFLQKIQPGGIIFFENNIKDKKQVKKLINEINGLLEIKPFIAVDQEGGSVERLRKVCTSVPSLWGLSKIGIKEVLESQKIIASELLELGFNMVFGPVLDINSNFENPVISTRAISGSPKIVSEYGSQIIDLFLRNNIIPVAKHFPGHGSVALDSHENLPILNKSKEELMSFELVPFKAAIKNKIPLIMVGHIQLPKIEKDKSKAATISKEILTNLLRKELNFKGIIITDELNMKAISKHHKLNIAAKEALSCGTNMILFNWEEEKSLNCYEYIKEIAIKDKSFVKTINESISKITSTKKKFLKHRKKAFLKEVKLNSLSNKLGQKVVHWIKKDLFFKKVRKEDFLEIIYPITPKLLESDLIKILNGLGLKKINLVQYEINPENQTIEKIGRKIKKNSRVILISYDIACRKRQKNLIEKLLLLKKDLIVISVGLEHDLGLVPSIRNFISAYAPNSVSLLAAFKLL